MYYVPLIMNEGIFLYGTSFCLLRYIDVNSYYFTKKNYKKYETKNAKIIFIKTWYIF